MSIGIAYNPCKGCKEMDKCSICEITYYRKGCIKSSTADVVEVRRGRWINNHCSLCGMTPLGEEMWARSGLTPSKFEMCMSFCPCCGAKMDGERGKDGK